jgi:hypothetical protein
MASVQVDEDTNANLTRRMLLMLESVAICGDSVHGDARRTLIAGYLGLLALLFDDPELRRWVREYLVF